AVVALEQRLVVVRVDLREPAVEEEVNDALGAGGEVRHPRRQRRRRAGGKRRARQQFGQREAAEAERRTPEDVAAGEEMVAASKHGSTKAANPTANVGSP